MRTFAHKPKANRQSTPAESEKPGCRRSGQRPGAISGLYLQHAPAKRPVQPLLQAKLEAFEAGSPGLPRQDVPTASVQPAPAKQLKQSGGGCDPTARSLPNSFRFRIREIFERPTTPFLCLRNRHMRVQPRASWNPRPARGTVPSNFEVSLYRAGGRQSQNLRGSHTIPIDGAQHPEEFRNQGAGTYYLTVVVSRTSDHNARLEGDVGVAGFNV